MSTCNTIGDLLDVEEITPIVIGGIGSGVSVTHKGYLRFLPRQIGECFFSPLMKVNLISLGAIQRGGGSYRTCPGELALEVTFNNVVVARSLLTSNNLFTVPLNLIKTDLYLSLVSPTDQQLTTYEHLGPAEGVTSAPVSNSHHLNKEELLRAQTAEDLHTYLDHPSDVVLCQALRNNSFTGPNITSTDVATNRRLRGPCAICIEAKLKR